MKPWRGLVRILLDTNNIISGMLYLSGPSGELMHLWGDGEFTLVTSQYQLEELQRVMRYKRLSSRILPEEAEAFFDNVDTKAIIVVEVPEVSLSPDPLDNPILGTAIAGGADLIVSGDKSHILMLGHVQGIPVVSARDALQLFRNDPGERDSIQ